MVDLKNKVKVEYVFLLLTVGLCRPLGGFIMNKDVENKKYPGTQPW